MRKINDVLTYFFRYRFIYFILMLAAGISCKKSTPIELPPITESGKNTFGCKVNGQIWVPYWRCSSIWTTPPELSYIIQPIDSSSSLPIKIWIDAGNATNGKSYFSFRQSYSLGDHIYGPGNIIDSLLIKFSLGSGTTYSNFQASSTPRYFQISRLDTTNKIVSGTFAFTLYTTINNILDSVVITDGRFDLQIGTYSRCSP
jgi:hypothetical protein